MSMSRVDAIANAVLYEGFMLYPYRASAIKNQQRFNFGVVVPEAKPRPSISSELSRITTECLLRGNDESQIDIEVRFLQLVQRDCEIPGNSESDAGKTRGNFVRVEKAEVNERVLSSWQEAIEQRVGVGPLAILALLNGPIRKELNFGAVRETEPIYDQDGDLAARFVRHREPLCGYLEVRVVCIAADLFKIEASIVNTSALSDAAGASHETAMLSSFLSTHKVLRCKGAAFISLTDPPSELQEFAAGCKNTGTWPVLAGEVHSSADVLLSSPIILYDYPEIAPESAGELFDGTEIDEILALRILTMTDDEKREMRSVDDRTRAILERTELLPPEHFMKLHGAMRALAPAEKERS
jgi:hypothetical protein